MMMTDFPQMVMYVGLLDKQYERLCVRLEDLNYPIIYAADAIHAKRLIAVTKPMLIVIHSEQFDVSTNANSLRNLIQLCKNNRTDVIKLKAEGLSVVFNNQLSRPDFSSVS